MYTTRKLSIFLLLLLYSVPAFAVTRTVDDSGGADFLTIQAAINASSFGDTVYVNPGHYREKVTMKNGVNLIGADPHVCTIDGEGIHNQVVTYDGNSGAILSGLRITGSATGVSFTRSGVYIKSGPLTVRNNIIEGNWGGICIMAAANPDIVNNTIINNLNGIIVQGRSPVEPSFDFVLVYEVPDLYPKIWPFLDELGYSVEAIHVSEVPEKNLSDYGAIVVLSDTDAGNEEWGTPEARDMLMGANLPILGFGRAGMTLLNDLGAQFDQSNSIDVETNALQIGNPEHPIFANSGLDSFVEMFDNFQPVTMPFFDPDSQFPNNLMPLGFDPQYSGFSPMVQQGHNLFLGFDLIPSNLTEQGRVFFQQVFDWLIPIFPVPDATHRIMNNIIVENTQTGIFYYRWVWYDVDILYNDVWSNTFRNYHNNNGGTTFVPSPGTGEISADPLFADGDYRLQDISPCKDTGHPALEYYDPDGTRNDMGAWGGPGGGGLSSNPGSGFIFTAIGLTPTSEIQQNAAAADHGLADVDPIVAADLGIPQWEDAPFGGTLWIYGLFGDLDDVDYYRILVAPWDGATPPGAGDYVPLDGKLNKIRYTFTPPYAQNVNLGPQTYGGVSDVYQYTRNGFWSYLDLRIRWNTTEKINGTDVPRWPNGKYNIKAQGYKDVAGTLFPVVVGVHPLDDIDVVINNTRPEFEIHNVKYIPSNPLYDPNTDGEILECAQIGLQSDTETLRFTITAKHDDGYLNNYSLRATYGKNKFGGTMTSATYTPPGPLWNGVTHVEIAYAPGVPVWQECAYQFILDGWARTINGTNRLYYGSFKDHYYINLNATDCRRADIDGNGFIGMGDFGILSSYWAQPCSP